MRFPLIKIIDNGSQDKTPHIFGTDIHDILIVDKYTGGLQYYNCQCGDGTGKENGESTFEFYNPNNSDYIEIEMVTIEELIKIHAEQTEIQKQKEINFKETDWGDFIDYILSKR